MVWIGQNTAAAEKLTALLERMENLLDEIDAVSYTHLTLPTTPYV